MNGMIKKINENESTQVSINSNEISNNGFKDFIDEANKFHDY